VERLQDSLLEASAGRLTSPPGYGPAFARQLRLAVGGLRCGLGGFRVLHNQVHDLPPVAGLGHEGQC
jgi:hypothetical protein